MTRLITANRVLLVADRRTPATSRDVPVRRYRLARLRFDSRPAAREPRFEYLKRVYD